MKSEVRLQSIEYRSARSIFSSVFSTLHSGFDARIILTSAFRPLFLILLAGALSALAARPITIDEAVELALDRSPSMEAARAAVDLTDARVREVVAGVLPGVKLTAGYTRLSDVEPFTITLPTKPPLVETLSSSIRNNYASRLAVQQPIFTGLRVISGLNVARDLAAAARQDQARDRAALIYNVRGAYWGLFKAREARKVVDRSVEQIGAHVRDVENLAASGLATRNDVLKVKLQYSNVELLQVDAANAVQIANSALNSLIGEVLDTELEPGSEPDSSAGEAPDSEDLDALVDHACAVRPEVKGLELRAHAARNVIVVARGAWFPQIALTGNYYYSRPNQRIQPPRDEFNSTWDVGVGASWDVWNWGIAGHQTAQAKAQYAQARAGLAQLRDAVSLEVTQDVLALQRARERARVTAQAVEQASENQRVAEAAFKVGTLMSSELLDAEVSLLQAQLARTQALADIELARAKLDRTTGKRDE